MNRQTLVAVLLFCSVITMYGAYRVNTSSGELKVTNVIIPGANTITGVLYEPMEPQSDAPCVLLAHGITNSKEPLSGLALELAKHGYIALSIDLVGHGGSSGSLDGSDPSLGVAQSAEYLIEYSDNRHIGLVGHSLGAGAVYYAASHGVSENGVVFIGGGIGSNYYNESDGFVVPQPWNPLVIIGRYDVLFSEARIQESLEITFPFNTPELDRLMGDPDSASMRLLMMPSTSHLFEPVDPFVMASTVDWFNKINGIETDVSQTYLRREALILVSFLLFVAAIVFTFMSESRNLPVPSFDWRDGGIYGLIGFITFIPAMFLGNLVSFPSQVFGSSIAWWLLVWGAIIWGVSVCWKKHSPVAIDLDEVVYGLALFFFAYLFCFGLYRVFGFGFRVLVPVMRPLSLRRILAFISYLPFTLAHFYIEGSWFRDKASSLMGFGLSKLGLFSGVLLVQYGGFYLFDVVFVSGFPGFILEFLMAIVPLMVISVLITSYGARNGKLGVSIGFNGLLFGWIAAGLFPY